MKAFHLIVLCSSACVIALLTSCGSSGSSSVSENTAIRGYNAGVGPFNTSGDYVEAWADDKRKGRWWRKSIITTGPSNAVAKKSSKPKSKPKPKRQLVYKPVPAPPAPPVIAAVAPQPKAPTYKAPQYTAPKPKVSTYKAPQYTPPKPKVVVKPKPKAVKVAPKRKAPIKYIVRSKDTLWSISQKYKISVDAIKAANGLRNNSIYGGKVLLIPQY